MFDWKTIHHQLQQIASLIVSFLKARKLEDLTLIVSAILLSLSHFYINLLPDGLKNYVKNFYGEQVVPAILLVAGVTLFIYFFRLKWKRVQVPISKSISNQPSAIKGAQAFTISDGEIFRQLGREDTLKELLGHIEDDQVCLIALMGDSGAGKTSLLRAGLTDIIKDKNINYHYWEAVPTDSEQALLRAIKMGWNLDSDSNVNNLQPEPDSLEYLIKLSSEGFSKNKHVIILDQFEQLHGHTEGQIFNLLKQLVSRAKPPYFIKWVVSFRSEFAKDWLKFMISIGKSGFHPKIVDLPLFTTKDAKDVTKQLISIIGLNVNDAVVDNLIDAAATTDGCVLSVDIGIGLLTLSGLHVAQVGETITEEHYSFAGEAEGLLMQYIDRCLRYIGEDSKTIVNAMLSLRNIETN